MRWRTPLIVMAVALIAFLVLAYAVLPLFWWEHERGTHPAIGSMPKVTLNAQGIPGDPLNVGLVGDREDVVRAMLAAGWRPADPVTFETSVKIAESVVFHRPDPDAPVSSLFVFGRKQDLAFEQEVGNSASRRHHVRYWRSTELDEEGRPLWIGSATFDIGSGLSHRTGQITHHIDANVDGQRDELMAALNKAGMLEREYEADGVGSTQKGTNAGGDRYFTDGRVRIGVLAKASTASRPPTPETK